MVSPAVATSKTLSPECAALARAFGRAVSEKIVVFRISPTSLGVATVADGRWTRKPYTLSVVGERAQDVVCCCPASLKGRECKHRATGIFCRKYGVYARQPQPAFDPSNDLPPSLRAARAGLR
jgi:hypothetical protein